MSGRKKFFLDTAPIIYFLEGNKERGLYVYHMLEKALNNGDILAMSTLSYGEYLTIPYKNNDVIKERNFYKFIKDLNIIVYDINIEVMKLAAKLRAKYKMLKLPDAIQIATSIQYNCEAFWTNDKKLKHIEEINCIMIEDSI